MFLSCSAIPAAVGNMDRCSNGFGRHTVILCAFVFVRPGRATPESDPSPGPPGLASCMRFGGHLVTIRVWSVVAARPIYPGPRPPPKAPKLPFFLGCVVALSNFLKFDFF